MSANDSLMALPPDFKKRIQIEIDAQLAVNLDSLVDQINARAGSESFNSHGRLTVKKLAVMLLENAGMVISRPGSWEGANMADLLRCHGYSA
ncbi:hypothetical protein HER14_17970 [Acidithiobacillus thiooxidans]|uniref:hypothetical protein n=1 Tax=Acidithiobacillus thiooxidans TaxID=930 RepID=UPI001C078F89|nr:hypothetical protein [Acidithiobacillus thiooxidans]MBU2752757.1 hypothetical protein [Acidithiobacillus thiooxidans]